MASKVIENVCYRKKSWRVKAIIGGTVSFFENGFRINASLPLHSMVGALSVDFRSTYKIQGSQDIFYCISNISLTTCPTNLTATARVFFISNFSSYQ